MCPVGNCRDKKFSGNLVDKVVVFRKNKDPVFFVCLQNLF